MLLELIISKRKEIIATINNALRINYIKAKIDNTNDK